MIWPQFDNAGTQQSPDAVRIVERYVPTEDESRLDFEVAVADAATFTALQRSLGYFA